MNAELIEEGRACAVNAVCAYGQAFGLLNEEDIDEELLAEIAGYIEGLEALMPVLVSMYEMTKKLSGNPDLTFMEWADDLARRMGDKGLGL